MKRTTSPAKHLQSELQALRRELRTTVRAYTARLELQLAESVAATPVALPSAELSREQLHEIRDLLSTLRKRKLKPEKGRRKDLRKIDSLIGDIHAAMYPQLPR
ncbi:MAG: hypothetical protein H0T11_08930 [Chthoniobacterales bacterium]|nr:hypothetical protein [Chthoniobacterales bacterium]